MAQTEVICERGITQGEVVALFEVIKPRVFDLVRGKTSRFLLDTLVDMTAMMTVSNQRPPLTWALRCKRRVTVKLTGGRLNQYFSCPTSD